MTQLEDALTGVVRLGLDTAPIIYFVEVHPRCDALVAECALAITCVHPMLCKWL